MICTHCRATWTDAGTRCPACGETVPKPQPVAVVVTPRGPRICCTAKELDEVVELAEARDWAYEEYWSPDYAAFQLLPERRAA